MSAGVLPEVNFSDLIQHPTETVARLEGGQRHALKVNRRGAEALVLTTAARASQDHELVDVATRMLMAVLGDPVIRSKYLLDIVPKIFPWVRFLPAEETGIFAQELIEVMQASEDLDVPAPVLQVIAEWRHTAEVHADPELFARLRGGSTGDHGRVPEPPK